jgi:hypothetical protein
MLPFLALILFAVLPTVLANQRNRRTAVFTNHFTFGF